MTIDMNGDGIRDFKFNAWNVMWSAYSQGNMGVRVIPLGSNQVGSDTIPQVVFTSWGGGLYQLHGGPSSTRHRHQHWSNPFLYFCTKKFGLCRNRFGEFHV